MQRDSLASHIGHYSRLAYMAVADNESISRMKYKFLMVSSPSFSKLNLSRRASGHVAHHRRTGIRKILSDEIVFGRSMYVL